MGNLPFTASAFLKLFVLKPSNLDESEHLKPSQNNCAICAANPLPAFEAV